jgi:hypothetical protein
VVIPTNFVILSAAKDLFSVALRSTQILAGAPPFASFAKGGSRAVNPEFADFNTPQNCH